MQDVRLEEELRDTFYKYYHNNTELSNKDNPMVDIPFGNVPAVDTLHYSAIKGTYPEIKPLFS